MTPITSTSRWTVTAVLVYIGYKIYDLLTRLDQMVERLHLFGWQYQHALSSFPDNSTLMRYAFSTSYMPNEKIQSIATRFGVTLQKTIHPTNPFEGKCRGFVLNNLARYHKQQPLATSLTWEACEVQELYLATSNPEQPGPSCAYAGLDINRKLETDQNRTSLLNTIGTLGKGTYVLALPTYLVADHTLGVIIEEGGTTLIDPGFAIATPKDHAALKSQLTTLFNYYGGERQTYSLYEVSQCTST